MPEYPQVEAGDDGRPPAPWLAATLGLGEVAGLVLEATVPNFAEAAGVFALESLLTGAEPGSGAAGGQVTVRRLGTGLACDGRPSAHPAFPPGEVLVFAAQAPYARCVRDRGPVIFTEPGADVLEQAGYRPQALAVMSGFTSFLAVPMTAGQAITGLLLFARGPAASPFSLDDAGQVAGLAARAGDCIASACLALGRQRATAAARRQPVPARPPALDAIEVAVRCLPAPGQPIGGDWWDVVPLPGGRAGLIAGDAMGHDQHAAAAMTQLRAAAHCLAELDLPPAEMLRRLDRTTAALAITPLATCICAVIDPASQACLVAGAGHLPPLIAFPDGTTAAPDLPSGLPIGLGTAIYGQITLPFPAGATLALYTDGLVDTRTRSSHEGIAVLRTAMASQRGPLTSLCDRLLRCLAPHPEDDTTLILARARTAHSYPDPSVPL